MAGLAVRTLLATTLITALADATAVRFGDRLAPRIPVPYAPRQSPSAQHYAENEDEDMYEQDYDEQNIPLEETDTHNIETEPPPKRPTRTEAHRLEMSTEFFIIPERPSSKPVPTATSRIMASTSRSLNTSIVTHAVPTYQKITILRAEPWAVPILALSCISMIVIGGFEGFVVWGASRKTPSHRHLLLGQTLLFGLFTCAAVAALFSATPTAFTCGAVRFGTGVAYVIVFASLLVKCVFLLSLNAGVYLPAAYQGLLLFFAVMIQVAIGAQWLGSSPPQVSAGATTCDSPLSYLLLSLCYAAFLIAVVCGIALRSRGIRDNYRESTHIAGAGGASAAIWVCWVAAALGAPEQHREACLAAGLLGTCSVVFALMFAPKGRRLAALGREGRWDADREEGLSSLGAGGSGYSPSFFHFKPVKYGIVSATSQAPLPPPILDHKDSSAQPADLYGAYFTGSQLHARTLCPPLHYPLHPLTHYQYSYPPSYYYLPPGVVMRPEEGNVYTSVEPTFSSNPNVFFQRTEPMHVGMMY